MTALTLLCALGLPAGFLLLRRIPTCPPAPLPVDAGLAASLSIIIPARNEQQNLPRLLNSIAHCGLPLSEVLVVDDGSTDDTAAVAAALGARVLPCPARPPGWIGKSWACHQGAENSTGQLLLFLDADTYFPPGGLDRLLSLWLRESSPRLVLSLLPYHSINAAYEQLSLFFNILMAAGAGGFSTLAPSRLFGQSLLLSREAYFRAGGHASVRGAVLENLTWATILRASGCTILCLGGRGTLHMRMFPEGFRQMSDSWSKAFVQGAADSGSAVLAVSTAWISALCFTTLLLLFLAGRGPLGPALVYLLFCFQITLLSRQLGNYSVLSSFLFPLPLAYYCMVFGRAAARRARGRKTPWKGREV